LLAGRVFLCSMYGIETSSVCLLSEFLDGVIEDTRTVGELKSRRALLSRQRNTKNYLHICDLFYQIINTLSKSV
jgi:hypothetical protein